MTRRAESSPAAPLWPLVSDRPLPRLHLLSDLHLESGPYAVPELLDFDIAVAAGDIGPIELAVPWLAALQKPVVFVLGNHERYGHGIVDSVVHAKRLAQGTQVRVLERGQVVIQGVRFLGCTLWTDLYRFDSSFVQAAHWVMKDYRNIGCDDWLADETRRRRLMRLCNRHGYPPPTADENGRTELHPGVTYLEHQASLKWLQSRLNRRHPGLTVVVTHHAPSFESLRRSGVPDDALANRVHWNFSDRYEQAKIAAYASDGILTRMDSECVDLWVHGHTHCGLDYVEKRIRVVCNPRGRPIKPLTQADVLGYALAGVSVSSADIKKSEARLANDPFRGDSQGFDRDLVIDFERGFERPIRQACEQPLQRLIKLRRQLKALLPYAGLGHSVPDRCVDECFEARLQAAREQTEAVIRSVFPMIERNWNVDAISRLHGHRPRVGALRTIWAGDEGRSPREFVEVYESLARAIRHLFNLPSAVEQQLLLFREKAARVMRVAERAEHPLQLVRLKPSALRSIDAHRMDFALAAPHAPKPDSNKGDVSDMLNAMLNAGKVPHRYVFSVWAASDLEGPMLDARGLYGARRNRSSRGG